MSSDLRNRSKGRTRRPPLLPRSAQGSGGRQIGLALAAILGWFLALGALQGWMDFRNLLRGEEQWFRGDMVFVNRQVKLSDSMGFTSSSITPSLLQRIREVEGVSIAEPVLRNHFPTTVEIGGGAIPSIVSEIFLEAIPTELFDPETQGWQWNPGDPVIPVLVPRQFLNLYNFGFAPGKGLPPVSEETAKRVRFSLIVYPAQGGNPLRFTASIAGFSDQIESILVPVSFLSWANQRYGSADSSGYNRVAVALQNPDSSAFYRLLEDNRLLSSRGTKETARLQILLDLSLGVLGSAGALILVLILLLFLAEAESLISDHRERIHKLYFLGHQPGTLLRRLVIMRLVSAVAPALIGLGLVWLSRRPIANFLEEAGLHIESHPANITFLAWALLLLLANLWLVWRIRRRLLKLYQ
ncbi:hypothetical protein [Puniceicoccus vermicola]|uniref:FtsX-like permease family protein n=1 Tax=Puniceicoccus vermicola TaxID=388746 RepID=A0A7X1AXV0_9BACT|nr:hypothetical protein [Puniceicoccus vermicola]MBC2602003.1 hypothetical protein [Puniceicoccus vermicola]